MIETTQAVPVGVRIDRVWTYVKDIRRWAELRRHRSASRDLQRQRHLDRIGTCHSSLVRTRTRDWIAFAEQLARGIEAEYAGGGRSQAAAPPRRGIFAIVGRMWRFVFGRRAQ